MHNGLRLPITNAAHPLALFLTSDKNQQNKLTKSATAVNTWDLLVFLIPISFSETACVGSTGILT